MAAEGGIDAHEDSGSTERLDSPVNIEHASRVPSA
jgi:hypothetical protein